MPALSPVQQITFVDRTYPHHNKNSKLVMPAPFGKYARFFISHCHPRVESAETAQTAREGLSASIHAHLGGSGNCALFSAAQLANCPQSPTISKYPLSPKGGFQNAQVKRYAASLQGGEEYIVAVAVWNS